VSYFIVHQTVNSTVLSVTFYHAHSKRADANVKDHPLVRVSLIKCYQNHSSWSFARCDNLELNASPWRLAAGRGEGTETGEKRDDRNGREEGEEKEGEV